MHFQVISPFFYWYQFSTTVSQESSRFPRMWKLYRSRLPLVDLCLAPVSITACATPFCTAVLSNALRPNVPTASRTLLLLLLRKRFDSDTQSPAISPFGANANVVLGLWEFDLIVAMPLRHPYLFSKCSRKFECLSFSSCAKRLSAPWWSCFSLSRFECFWLPFPANLPSFVAMTPTSCYAVTVVPIPSPRSSFTPIPWCSSNSRADCIL